jgi:hypothetical protein
MKKIIVFSLLLIINFSAYSQSEWKTTNIGIPSSVAINEFTAIGNVIFACGHHLFLNGASFESEIRLYKSSDNGISWSQVQTKGLTLLTGNSLFNFNNKLFISGAASKTWGDYAIYSSSDNGITWSQLNGIPSSVAINEFTAIGNEIFACGHHLFLNGASYESEIRLYKSSDNGISWSQVQTKGLTLLTGNSLFNFNNKLFISGAASKTWGDYSIYSN